MRVYALIPARSGSKGLPEKNIREVDGRSLLAGSIAFGRAFGIDWVILSTDSAKYAEIRCLDGAECTFLRSAAASTDAAREEDILEDLHQRQPEHDIGLPDVWVWLKPASPFRGASSVQEALSILRTRPEVVSFRLISEGDAGLQVINKDGYLERLLKEWPDHLSKTPRTFLRKNYYPCRARPSTLRERLGPGRWPLPIRQRPCSGRGPAQTSAPGARTSKSLADRRAGVSTGQLLTRPDALKRFSARGSRRRFPEGRKCSRCEPRQVSRHSRRCLGTGPGHCEPECEQSHRPEFRPRVNSRERTGSVEKAILIARL